MRKPQPPPTYSPPIVVSDGEDENTRNTSSQTPSRTQASADIPIAHLAIDFSVMAVASPQSPSQASGSVTPARRPARTNITQLLNMAVPPPTPAAEPRALTVDTLLEAHRRHPPRKPGHLKYFAIAQGKTVGIILGWDHAKPFVDGNFKKCLVTGWDTLDQAIFFMQVADAEGKVFPIRW